MDGWESVDHPVDASGYYRGILWQNTCRGGKIIRPQLETRSWLRIHRDQPVMRICGSLLGIGFVLLGSFSILGAGDLGEGVHHDRAMGFGATAIIVGIIAVLCSLLVRDLSNIWCRHPRRWK